MTTRKQIIRNMMPEWKITDKRITGASSGLMYCQSDATLNHIYFKLDILNESSPDAEIWFTCGKFLSPLRLTDDTIKNKIISDGHRKINFHGESRVSITVSASKYEPEEYILASRSYVEALQLPPKVSAELYFFYCQFYPRAYKSKKEFDNLICPPKPRWNLVPILLENESVDLSLFHSAHALRDRELLALAISLVSAEPSEKKYVAIFSSSLEKLTPETFFHSEPSYSDLEHLSVVSAGAGVSWSDSVPSDDRRSLYINLALKLLGEISFDSNLYSVANNFKFAVLYRFAELGSSDCLLSEAVKSCHFDPMHEKLMAQTLFETGGKRGQCPAHTVDDLAILQARELEKLREQNAMLQARLAAVKEGASGPISSCQHAFLEESVRKIPKDKSKDPMP